MSLKVTSEVYSFKTKSDGTEIEDLYKIGEHRI